MQLRKGNRNPSAADPVLRGRNKRVENYPRINKKKLPVSDRKLPECK